MPRLTDEQKVEVVELNLKQNFKVPAIANAYGVSDSTIYALIAEAKKNMPPIEASTEVVQLAPPAPSNDMAQLIAYLRALNICSVAQFAAYTIALKK